MEDVEPLFTPSEFGNAPLPSVPIAEPVLDPRKRSNQTCSNCLGVGHRADVCTNPRHPRARDTRNPGMLRRQVERQAVSPSTVTCSNCLGIGHRRDACPNENAPTSVEVKNRQPGRLREQLEKEGDPPISRPAPTDVDVHAIEKRIDALGEENQQYQRVKDVADRRIRENNDEIDRLWEQLKGRWFR